MLIAGLRPEPNAAANKASESGRRSIEKLAAGQRISRSADDPAGLVAAEQLRGQSSTMGVALRNTQDGLNVLRVADSALAAIMGLVEHGRDLRLSLGGFKDVASALAAAEEWAGVGRSIEDASKVRFAGVPLLDGNYRLNVVLSSEPPENIGVSLASSSGGFSLEDLGLGTGGSPTALEFLTVDAFDAALGQVLVARSAIGATENRLAYASNVLMAAMVSSVDAESRVRSVDYHRELVDLARSQILLAAGTASASDLSALHKRSIAALAPSVVSGGSVELFPEPEQWPDDPGAYIVPDRQLTTLGLPKASFAGLSYPSGLLVDVSL